MNLLMDTWFLVVCSRCVAFCEERFGRWIFGRLAAVSDVSVIQIDDICEALIYRQYRQFLLIKEANSSLFKN